MFFFHFWLSVWNPIFNYGRQFDYITQKKLWKEFFQKKKISFLSMCFFFLIFNFSNSFNDHRLEMSIWPRLMSIQMDHFVVRWVKKKPSTYFWFIIIIHLFQVSAEAPSFQTVRKEKELHIYSKFNSHISILFIIISSLLWLRLTLWSFLQLNVHICHIDDFIDCIIIEWMKSLSKN